MKKIPVDEFAEEYVKTAPSETLEEVKAGLREAVQRKNNGATCECCDRPIWAVGSYIVGRDLCFTCITGEADDSDDYEVYIPSKED